jgi:hypothetical protein
MEFTNLVILSAQVVITAQIQPHFDVVQEFV